MNKLGLSTQVPVKVVYLPDGAARTVNVGRRTITFKKTSPKNLLAKGEISSLAIQALKIIGQNNLDEKTIEKIQAIKTNIVRLTVISFPVLTLINYSEFLVQQYLKIGFLTHPVKFSNF